MENSIENWNPQDYHDGLLKNTPVVTISTRIFQTINLEWTNIEPEEPLNLTSEFNNTNGSHSPSIFDCDNEEIVDT